MDAAASLAAPPQADELSADSSFARRWRGFMTARVAIGTMLLALLGALFVLAPALNVTGWLVSLSAAYLLAGLIVRLFARPLPAGHSFDPQWVSTIGVDLVAFATLQLLHAGGINYSPLFALPSWAHKEEREVPALKSRPRPTASPSATSISTK